MNLKGVGPGGLACRKEFDDGQKVPSFAGE
jgi:hypothetical protein